jgi:hypothetical protein
MAQNEGFVELYRIICNILNKPDSIAFREPVDWRNLGLDDYLDFVKHPMDLGTIKIKLETEKYVSIEDVVSDVRLVWRNCMEYNGEESPVSCSSSFSARYFF